MGLFIPCCTASEIAAHSDVIADVSHPSARGEANVAFDYMDDLFPRFQSWENEDYYTPECEVTLYPILDADAADVHAACMEVARAAPRNTFWHRLNGLFPWWPFRCAGSNTPSVAPSTCVALTMRILARARTGDASMYTSDAATFRELGMPRLSCASPCAPRFLTGYSPRAGLEAMQRGGVLGRPLHNFPDAIASCMGDRVARALGNAEYPLLAVGGVPRSTAPTGCALAMSTLRRAPSYYTAPSTTSHGERG